MRRCGFVVDEHFIFKSAFDISFERLDGQQSAHDISTVFVGNRGGIATVLGWVTPSLSTFSKRHAAKQ